MINLPTRIKQANVQLIIFLTVAKMLCDEVWWN